MSTKTLGQELRRQREGRRISLRKFAQKLEIAPAFLVDLEKDRRQPPPKLLQRIADELDIPLSTFDEFSPDIPRAVKEWVGAEPLVGRALKALAKLSDPETAVSFLERGAAHSRPRRFPVAVYESELRAIGLESSSWETETGGDLFGVWGDIPIIYLATRSGPNSIRDQAHFRLDVEYLIKLSVRLEQEWGLRYFGDWHSHHRLGLESPSRGDRDRIQRVATKNAFQEMVEFIVTFAQSVKSDQVFRIHPYAYLNLPSDDTTEILPMVLTGTSPVREALQARGAFPEQQLGSYASFTPDRIDLPKEPLPRIPGNVGPPIQPITHRLIRRAVEELEAVASGHVELHKAEFGWVLVAPITDKTHVAFAVDQAWPHRVLQVDLMDRDAGTTVELPLAIGTPSMLSGAEIVTLYHAAKQARR